MAESTKTHDLAVIGSGPGGYVAALRAGILGLDTVLIEKDPLLGGTCLHRGCIPTKALLHTAHLYGEIRNASAHGIVTGEIAIDFKKTQTRKNRIVRKLAKGIEYLMKKRRVEVVRGRGRILEPGTVCVESEAGEKIVSARNIVLATGSVPTPLPHIVPDGNSILNSDHILDLESIPSSLAVIGAGAVGVEFASIFSSLGTEVHLVEILPRVLPMEDEEISGLLEKALESRGMKIHTSSEVKEVKKAQGKAGLVVSSGGATFEITCEKVLLSVGRKPSLDGLGLEEAGIEKDGSFVRVDDFMRTGVDGIFAIGDIVNSPQLAHVASSEGIHAVDFMAGRKVQPIDYKKSPSCTYSRPEVASVGLKEKEAIEMGYDIEVGRFPFAASGKASILGEPEGLVKIVSEKRYGEILGVHIVGPAATELIAEACLAVNLEATAESLAGVIHAHPTLSEAMMEAAHDVYGEAIHF